jgi:hypothetical protein
MRIPWVPLLALAAASQAALALEVAHDPITCTAPDRYVRITARGVPAETVAAGEVGFRAGPQSDWYTVAMTGRDGAWTALLPRPTTALGRFEYRVVLTGTDAASVTTQPLGVSVAADCPAVEGTALAAAIVVHVPPGAPAIPPVPPGFSPVGATAPQAAAAAAKKGLSGGKLLLGAGVLAAAGAGAALAVDEGEPGPLDVPGFRFDRTMPPPGATISEPRGDRLSVVILMEREPDQPFNVEWGVDLLASPAGPSCGLLAGTFSHAQRPLGLVLSSRVINAGRCGSVFDVTTLRITAIVDGVTVYQQEVAAPFHFEI